jgi:hypothetical protein
MGPAGTLDVERLAAVGDLWAELAASGQSVREASERLRRL